MPTHLSKYLDYYGESSDATPVLSAEECRVIPWFRVGGDKKYRYSYPLTKQSVVYDMGGYEGEWTTKINDLYECRIEVFEPVKKFAEALEKKFKHRPNVQVHAFGLAGSARTEKINLDLASSSTYKKGGQTEAVKLIRAADFIQENTKTIDLIKINIEGGEYELLDHLIKTGLITQIKELQLQFHVFVPKARPERLRIQQLLSKTHTMTYNYPFIWENWRLK